ncbi:MAG: menaquinol oxidoreductase [Chloroflexi bacterium RBG_13_52_14]|nr:MAG: menaquinol oxidoreductase [Chloroflexi bacterium RBG_13_52_14]
MIEKAFTGDRKYWAWILFLLVVIAIGFGFYLLQWFRGLGITGMGRDVSWGLYIANMTFLVGVAAGAVMVVLPYYLHNYKAFGKITTFGEFLAVAAVIMCILFVTIDLGQPTRVVNLLLHPSLHSVLFWDVIVLSVYLLLNLVIAWHLLSAHHNEEAPKAWVKPLILISIPWAISIHTVTAFIYSGLAARPFWLTALMAPRFLASAFASGPALLIIACLIMKRFTRFDPGKEAMQKLAQIVAYGTIITVFFLIVESFTVFYGQVPEDMNHLKYFFFGLDGKTTLVPWMWTCFVFWIAAIVLLINPRTRKNEKTLAVAAVLVFVSMWIDKGLGLIMPGFTPSPTGALTEYWPTVPETLITLMVWAIGFLILTIFYKITISVKEESGEEESAHTVSS